MIILYNHSSFCKDFEELEEQNEDLTSEEDEDSVLDVNKPEKVDYKRRY